MKKNTIKYQTYVTILKNELVPAMGCTEPIALAFAAAKAREILGNIPDHVIVQVSGSIIKNVKSVIVPNTNHLKGIPAAVVAGIISGRPEKELEVLEELLTNGKIAILNDLTNCIKCGDITEKSDDRINLIEVKTSNGKNYRICTKENRS